MKLILVLAAVIVAVYSETCGRHDDCSLTMCASGAELHCIDRQCTCTTAASGGDGTCTTQDDCHGGCDHGRRHHCIDGRCRCTHF